MSGKHTLLLLQREEQPSSRIYHSFESLDKCLECTCHAVLCETFEEQLRQLYPQQERLQYEASQLLDFVEGQPDLLCLV